MNCDNCGKAIICPPDTTIQQVGVQHPSAGWLIICSKTCAKELFGEANA